ncbi:MAG TPA: hypothetical protein DCR97_08275 [Deltaproteobacteria bacterium]|nr:hypothetical protein [Deltaproteobacteria bacterium]
MHESVFKSRILRSKELILTEAREMQGFMHLLMKQRNTGSCWTKGEKAQLKRYIGRLAFYVPVLLFFLLPGGFILIPVLAEILDRRNHRRHILPEPAGQAIESTPTP